MYDRKDEISRRSTGVLINFSTPVITIPVKCRDYLATPETTSLEYDERINRSTGNSTVAIQK